MKLVVAWCFKNTLLRNCQSEAHQIALTCLQAHLLCDPEFESVCCILLHSTHHRLAQIGAATLHV